MVRRLAALRQAVATALARRDDSLANEKFTDALERELISRAMHGDRRAR